MGGEPAQRRRLRASQLAAGVGLCLALSASAVCAAGRAPVWAQLTVDQQTVLRPLQPEWDRLPEVQRQRLLTAAKRYPRMSPQQQQRFSQRLPGWTKLTLEQRNLARKRYAQYASLPRERQLEILKRWHEEHPEEPNPAP